MSEQIEFDPKKHLSPADQERLREAAEKAGMSPADFIETVLKRELFSGPLFHPEPKEAA